ncbi:MAG: hypothetical protein HQM08_11550 [Candidatus Riflebacteria bacterium]|nr:hypothetical protein [Candidatus Riflebacteria bacterium]
MIGVSDLEIGAGVRRELSGRRVDLSKLKSQVNQGDVTLSGELVFVGLKKTNEEISIEIKFLENRLRLIRGVKSLQFSFDNWVKNDSGKWESTGSPEKTADGELPSEGMQCPSCHVVFNFCPCCGKPLVKGEPVAPHSLAKPSLKVLSGSLLPKTTTTPVLQKPLESKTGKSDLLRPLVALKKPPQVGESKLDSGSTQMVFPPSTKLEPLPGLSRPLPGANNPSRTGPAILPKPLPPVAKATSPIVPQKPSLTPRPEAPKIQIPAQSRTQPQVQTSAPTQPPKLERPLPSLPKRDLSPKEKTFGSLPAKKESDSGQPPADVQDESLDLENLIVPGKVPGGKKPEKVSLKQPEVIEISETQEISEPPEEKPEGRLEEKFEEREKEPLEITSEEVPEKVSKEAPEAPVEESQTELSEEKTEDSAEEIPTEIRKDDSAELQEELPEESQEELPEMKPDRLRMEESRPQPQEPSLEAPPEEDISDLLPPLKHSVLPAKEESIIEDIEALLPPKKPVVPAKKAPETAKGTGKSGGLLDLNAKPQLFSDDSLELDESLFPPLKPDAQKTEAHKPEPPKAKIPSLPTPIYDEPPDLPPLKPASSSEGVAKGKDSGKPAARAPLKPIPSPPIVDDDTPLPPMKPQVQSPSPVKEKPAKTPAGTSDPFAALFSPSGSDKKSASQHLSQPASSPPAQPSAPPPSQKKAEPASKESLDDLASLDLGMLDLFQIPSNAQPPKTGASQTPKQSAKPAAKPAKKEEMLNLEDLLKFGEELPEKDGEPKAKNPKKDDPLSLDDFDLSKFKL